MLFVLFACSNDSGPNANADSEAGTNEASATPTQLASIKPASNTLRDLEDIIASGQLRVARQKWIGFQALPAEGISLDRYQRLAALFAEQLGVSIRWIIVENFTELLSVVPNGDADIAIGNISITPSRQQHVNFTPPLTFSEEWLIGRPAGTKIGIPGGTAYATTAEENELTFTTLPSWSADLVADAIAAGEIDQSIMDAVAARTLMTENPSLKLIRKFTARPLGWTYGKFAPALGEALDRFITEQHLGDRVAFQRRDFTAIKESGYLRLITIPGQQTYFLYKGELMGFEYELIRDFAARHDLETDVILAKDSQQAVEYLREGRGDVVSGSITITTQREVKGWTFTRPYLYAMEWLALADGAAYPPTDDRLTLHLNPETSHWQSGQTLVNQVPGIDVIASNLVPFELYAQVATGALPATLIDGHLMETLKATGQTVSKTIAISENEKGSPIGWVLNDDQPALRESLNEYIRDVYRGLHYNLLKQKYFGNARRVAVREPHRITGSTLSPYDNAIQELAATYDFDWRILVAQAYQESGFKPERTSSAGAKGLMQVMPRTAAQLGIDAGALHDPDIGLNAGVSYLAWCRERFAQTLPLSQRTWFALAAYNAGAGHVRDARKLAGEMGLNRDLWFDNVELAMLKLSLPEYARRAAHGYVRGQEPVNYVRQIRQRYRAYVDHLANLN